MSALSIVIVIVVVTLVWVIGLLAGRERTCEYLRKHSRRVKCSVCKAPCPLFDEHATADKPCSTYTGPERRHTNRHT